MERHEPSGQFYNWYDHRTGAKLTTWPPTGAHDRADPLLGRQRLAGGRPARRREPRAGAAGAGAAAVRLDGLRLLLPARGQPDPLPLRARHRRGGLLLRHCRLREPDRRLHRDREGRDPSAGVLRRLAVVPGLLRLVVPGDAAAGLHAQLPRRQCLRGRVSLQRHTRDAVVGREHVRGADAVAVRAGGALGAGQLGREPPALRAHADAPRAGGRRIRLLGLLPGQHPRGRVRGLRRRRHRHGPERLPVQRGQHPRRPRLRRLPRPRRRSPTRRRPRTPTAW